MADQEELAGPPGLSEAERRLAALLAHRKAVAEAPTEAEVKADPSFMKAILPLIIAQGLDLATTENLVRMSTPGPGWSDPMERNPLPGMQSTAGRLGWGGAETLVAALLTKLAPRTAKPMRAGLVGVHTGLARGNQELREEQMRSIGRERGK